MACQRIPGVAPVLFRQEHWMPAFAGMTGFDVVIPAYVGIQGASDA